MGFVTEEVFLSLLFGQPSRLRKMGCGSSVAAQVEENNFSLTPKDKDPTIKGVRTSNYDGSIPPILSVQSAGPEKVKASWIMPSRRLSGGSDIVFCMEVDSISTNPGYREVFRGSQDSFILPVEPGSSLRLRVCAMYGASMTEWSNEVHFSAQAVVPRRPARPEVSVDATAGSHPVYNVMWSPGSDGGLPIESFDVQMEMCDSNPAQEEQSVNLDGSFIFGKSRSSGQGSVPHMAPTVNIVYSGRQTSTSVSLGREMPIKARVRFRVQARNAMGYSEWSPWSIAWQLHETQHIVEGDANENTSSTEEASSQPRNASCRSPASQHVSKHAESPTSAGKEKPGATSPVISNPSSHGGDLLGLGISATPRMTISPENSRRRLSVPSGNFRMESAPELMNLSPCDLRVTWEPCHVNGAAEVRICVLTTVASAQSMCWKQDAQANICRGRHML